MMVPKRMKDRERKIIRKIYKHNYFIMSFTDQRNMLQRRLQDANSQGYGYKVSHEWYKKG